MPVVELAGVTKAYESKVAVRDLSLSIDAGQMFGLLGPNGAGKTSSIRMMMGITLPDSGTINLFGKPFERASLERVGYLPEERGLYKKMKVLEQLVFFGELHGLAAAEARKRATDWAKRLDIDEALPKKTEELSKGMQQKIQFIGSLLHDPGLIVMDEPFSGLDPVNAKLLEQTLLQLKDEGKAIIFSTHRMDQVEKLCDSICLINKGEAVLSGPRARDQVALRAQSHRRGVRGQAPNFSKAPRLPKLKTSPGTPRSASRNTATHKSCCAKPRPTRGSIALKWSSLRSKKSSFRRLEARSMRNIWLVARREYLEQVRGRAFKMTTFGVPAIFAALIGIGYLSSLGLGSGKHLAVASNDPLLAAEIKSQIAGRQGCQSRGRCCCSGYRCRSRPRLLTKSKSKKIDGFLWVDTPQGQAPTATYTSPSSGDFITGGRLHDAVNHALLDARLIGGGMPHDAADKLVDGVHIQTFQVKKDGSVVKSNAAASFYKGYIMAILLSMTTMIYGMNVARSIIQEKTSRIFEVMLAITKPTDMLAGKLIGVGAVGLTQIGIWLVAGAVLIGTPIAAKRPVRRIRGACLRHRSDIVPGLFRVGLPALQFPLRWPCRFLRNRTGTADVYAAGGSANVAELLADHAGHQRLELVLVGSGVSIPADGARSSCFCACLRRFRRHGNSPSPSAF